MYNAVADSQDKLQNNYLIYDNTVLFELAKNDSFTQWFCLAVGQGGLHQFPEPLLH